MDLNEMTDYCLVEKILNENCEKCKIFLFKKYLPIINKFAYKISFYGKNREISNDFKQDSYFKYEECLKGIRLEKISTQIRNKWIFSSRFIFYLKNLYKEYSKNYSKNYSVSLDENIIYKNNVDNYKYSCLKKEKEEKNKDVINKIYKKHEYKKKIKKNNKEKVYKNKIANKYLYNHDNIYHNDLESNLVIKDFFNKMLNYCSSSEEITKVEKEIFNLRLIGYTYEELEKISGKNGSEHYFTKVIKVLINNFDEDYIEGLTKELNLVKKKL